MGITRDILPHQFENIAPGEEDPQKRVDAERIMANYHAITSVIAVVEARGENALDGNSNGISTQTQCNLTVHTKDGEVGLLDVGDVVVISDGDNVWQKRTDEEPTTQLNDEISFSDDNLVSGEGVSDYSDSGFIEDLLITIRKPDYPDLVLSDRILLGGEKGLSATAIPRTSTSEDTVEGTLTDLETNVTAEHNEDGSHIVGLFVSSHLAEDGFEGETFQNLIDGSFERDGDCDGVAEPWTKFNEPELTLSDEEVYQGNCSQMVVASQPGDGIETTLTDITYIKGKKLIINIHSFTSSAQTKIEVYDGVSTTVSEGFGVSGEWVGGHLAVNIDENATEVTLRVYADGADTQYYDACVITLGGLIKGYTSNSIRPVIDFCENTSPTNYLFGFEEWTEKIEDDVVLPDGWDVGNETPTFLKSSTDEPRVGDVCCEITLYNNEGIIQEIPTRFIPEMIDEPICLSLYIRKETDSTDPLLITIEGDSDLISQAVVEMSELSESLWRRVHITSTPNPSTTEMRVRVENMTGTSDFTHCYLDGIMLHRGIVPLGYFPENVYDRVLMTFGNEGEIEGGYISGSGGVSGDGFPVPFVGRLKKVVGYVSTPPSSQGTEFDVEVRVNGNTTDLVMTFLEGENDAEVSQLADFDDGDRVSIFASLPPIGTDAEDLFITLEVLRYRR